MVITTLSAKNQTTLGMEFITALGLSPGTQLKQSFDGRRITIEPIEDVMTAFGSLKSSIPFTSIAEETEGMEAAVANEIVAKGKRS